jgi:hypothetical protein
MVYHLLRGFNNCDWLSESVHGANVSPYEMINDLEHDLLPGVTAFICSTILGSVLELHIMNRQPSDVPSASDMQPKLNVSRTAALCGCELPTTFELFNSTKNLQHNNGSKEQKAIPI